MSTDPQDQNSDEPGTDQPDQDDPTQDDCGCSSPHPGDCDPDLLDDLKCRADGVAAQAAYNVVVQPKLAEAREQYPTVRTGYRAARTEATLEVQDLRHQVKQLLERVRCQFTQTSVVECLDDAYCCVVKKLKKCGGTSGCCSSEPCDFDVTCPESYDELVARMAEYAARLGREKACFERLAGEPDALRARVAAAKAEIDAAAAKLEGDQATLDLKRVYVELLVAQRHLKEIWNGFARTQDFLDCLCHALTCWIKATEAVSVLTGHKAVKDCRRQETAKHCQRLAEQTTDEVLLEYERLCGKDPCGDDEPEPDECEDEEQPESDDCEDEEPSDEDCDCGNEHHHHPKHDHPEPSKRPQKGRQRR